jgi:hypothetical protein
MKDIRLSDDVTKLGGHEVGWVSDRMLRDGMLEILWLDSQATTLENPDDLEILTYGHNWTRKEAKADAKQRGLKIREKTIIR